MKIDPLYRDRVRTEYNQLPEIWDTSDRWHQWAKRQIESEMLTIKTEVALDGPGSLVVDVGSAGNFYSFANVHRVDVDLAEKRIAGCPLAVCGNVEALPLQSQVADLTICVGSVLNYASLEEALFELHRVTKVGGTLIFQLELSNASEFIGTPAYTADAAFVSTFYRGEERLWVYSDSYVKRTLATTGLALCRVRYFHLLSSFFLRLTRRPDLAARIALFDWPWAKWRPAGRFADSGIYVCRRDSC